MSAPTQTDLRSLTGSGPFVAAPVHRNAMTADEMLALIAKYGRTEDPMTDEELRAHSAAIFADHGTDRSSL